MMKKEYQLPAQLLTKNIFSRKEFIDAYSIMMGPSANSSASYALRKMVSNNIICHIGRNQYTATHNKARYQHHYSEESIRIVDKVEQDYADATFRVFELVQLNDFMNHQIAHNTIFVYVESELMDFVFDTLKNTFPGRVMLKPTVEEYYRYLVDDEIVINRLPSETPKGAGAPWHSSLEKILVDVAVDKLLHRIVPSGEYHNIFDEAFSRYTLDERSMLRYARRKGAEQKYKAFMKEYVPATMEG